MQGMSFFRTAKAIVPLVILMLLLPLQGHARLAAAAMPCPMEHPAMHDVGGMPDRPMDQPCDSGAPCSLQCIDCASCAHAVTGMAVSDLPSQAKPGAPVYTPQPIAAFSSTILFQDHPPPRNR